MACGVNGLRSLVSGCRQVRRYPARCDSIKHCSGSSLWRPWDKGDKALDMGPMPTFELTPLLHRDLINFANWTREDIFSLLWIALDLKRQDPEICRTLGQNKTVVLLYENLITKTAILKGLTTVGAIPSTLHLSQMDKSFNVEYFFKSIATESDAIFIESSELSMEQLDEIRNASSVPVINIRSADIAPPHILAELLTLYEHYGYLRRLNVSYIGRLDNPLMRTYVTLLPKIGMHFRYTANDEHLPHELWSRGVRMANNNSFKTNLLHASNFDEAVFRTHVIVTCYQDPSEGSNQFYLDSEKMEEAELDWVFLHHDIHKGTCCNPELLNSKQCLVWKYMENLSWLAKAAIVALTTSYVPRIPPPGFQGKV